MRIWLVPLPGNECNTAQVNRSSVAATSNRHQQDVEADSLTNPWELTLLLGYLKRKEYNRRDVCLLKGPQETMMTSTLPRFNSTLCSNR